MIVLQRVSGRDGGKKTPSVANIRSKITAAGGQFPVERPQELDEALMPPPSIPVSPDIDNPSEIEDIETGADNSCEMEDVTIEHDNPSENQFDSQEAPSSNIDNSCEMEKNFPRRGGRTI